MWLATLSLAASPPGTRNLELFVGFAAMPTDVRKVSDVTDLPHIKRHSRLPRSASAMRRRQDAVDLGGNLTTELLLCTMALL
jgi:hypothetical protein